MWKIISILSVLLLFIASCNNANKSSSTLPYHVNIERDINNFSSVPLSSLGSKLEYIPLETDSSCFIEEISTISVTDSFIFVSDMYRLLLFSRSGKFLRKIGTAGRGPGEYLNLGDIRIDEQDREVYLLSPKVILVFGFNGEFKRDFKIDFPSRQFVFNKNEELVIHPINLSIPSTKPVYSWFIVDRFGSSQANLENTLKRVNQGLFVPNSPLYIFNGTPHFMEFGIDTLYNYDDNKKIPHAVFQFGKLKFPPDPTMEEVPNIKGKVWINDIKEIEKLLLLKVWWNLSDSIRNGIFDKSSSKFTLLKNNGFTNDIDNGPPFWPKEIMNDNYMIGYKDAFELIKYSNKMKDNRSEIKGQLKEIIRNLTETSNPVIIILKK